MFAVPNKIMVEVLIVALVVAVTIPKIHAETVEEIDVKGGQKVEIPLGQPPAGGWKINVWGGYKVDEGELFAPGKSHAVNADINAMGCVYVISAGGSQCFAPAEDKGGPSHLYIKPVGGQPLSLGIVPPAGAHGKFYYFVE